MDPAVTFHSSIVSFDFKNATSESELAPFEQLLDDAVKSIFALLSSKNKQAMHLTSSRFALILLDDNYCINYRFERLKNATETHLAFLLQYKHLYRDLNVCKLLEGLPLESVGFQMRSMMTSFTDLTVLNLSTSGKCGPLLINIVKSRFLKELTILTNLTSLNLCNSKVTEEGMQDVGKFTTLKVLNLGNNQFCFGEGVKNLINLPLLRDLHLCDSDISDQDMNYIAALTNLRTLDLYRCSKITKVSLTKIISLTNLVSLNLAGVQVDEETLDALSLLKLEFLDLSFTKQCKDFHRLKMYTRLTTLKLKKTSFLTVSSLEAISMLPSLQFLDLFETDLSLTGLNQISKLQKLKFLDLCGLKITLESPIKIMGQLNHLQYLNINRSRCGDEALQSLFDMRDLKELYMHSCKISARGIDSITHLTSLKMLDVSQNPLTDAGAIKLTTLTNLKHLKLNSTQITNAAIIAIAKSSMRALKVLHSDHNYIDAAILDDLDLLQALREISFYTTKINKSELTKKLASNKKLSMVNYYDSKDFEK